MQRNTLEDKIIKYVKSCSDKIDHNLTEEQFSKFCKGIQSLIDTSAFKGPEGSIGITYAGYYGDTACYMVAREFSKASNGKYCYVTDTDAGKLLNSVSLKQAIDAVIGEKNRKILFGGKTVNGQRSPYAAGDALALNDYVSKGFVKANARGNMWSLTQNTTEDNVWALTELETGLSHMEALSYI